LLLVIEPGVNVTSFGNFCDCDHNIGPSYLVQRGDAVDVLCRVDLLPVLLVVDGLHLAVDGCRVNLLDVVLGSI
jgi:hypothetical protein